jgi:hypothetical protein
MFGSLMLTLLLMQQPAKTNERIYQYDVQKVQITQGTDLNLAFQGFSKADMIEIKKGANPSNNVIVLSAPIRGGVVQNKVKAFTLQQSGNTLVFTPTNDGHQGALIRIVVPNAPVHIQQDGQNMPFGQVLYLEGNYNSQDATEYNRKLEIKFFQKQLSTQPVDARDKKTGLRSIPANQAVITYRAPVQFTSQEQAQALSGTAGLVSFRVQVSPSGDVVNVVPTAPQMPSDLLAKVIAAVHNYKFQPLVVSGQTQGFLTNVPLVFGTGKP